MIDFQSRTDNEIDSTFPKIILGVKKLWGHGFMIESLNITEELVI